MEPKKPNAPHWIFYVIAALLAVIAALLVALLIRPANLPDTPETTPGTTLAAIAPGDETTLPTQAAESPGIPLDARWTTLFLPEELEGTLIPKTQEAENSLRLGFYAEIEGQELELFSLELTKGESEGYRLGTLSTADGNIYVYTSVNEQPADAWSEEAFSRIDELQQRVNDLIAQFYEDARFQADR